MEDHPDIGRKGGRAISDRKVTLSIQKSISLRITSGSAMVEVKNDIVVVVVVVVVVVLHSVEGLL